MRRVYLWVGAVVLMALIASPALGFGQEVTPTVVSGSVFTTVTGPVTLSTATIASFREAMQASSVGTVALDPAYSVARDVFVVGIFIMVFMVGVLTSYLVGRG